MPSSRHVFVFVCYIKAKMRTKYRSEGFCYLPPLHVYPGRKCLGTDYRAAEDFFYFAKQL